MVVTPIAKSLAKLLSEIQRLILVCGSDQGSSGAETAQLVIKYLNNKN